MRPEEAEAVAGVLGRRVVSAATLAGGYSHETSLLTLDGGGRVVVRLGGPDPAVEAAVMALGRRHAPVPEVLAVLPATDGHRAAMVLEHVAGTPLSDVLADGGAGMAALGAEVGRVAAAIGDAALDRPGFFAGADLAVDAGPPWSAQLAGFADSCMARTPDDRLDLATRSAWSDLCATHAPALASVDGRARLVHADVNPKNILVSRAGAGWRVDAMLDWEFAYSGCPYGDAANMARFGGDYPPDFLAAFLSAFGGAATDPDWLYLGRVLDMFALSDLVTRPPGNPVADQAATVIRAWAAAGVPG
jgi:aminoglycoside phosphotransferase (APT) family kinase protein